jgi:hypothetical protein
MPAEVKAHHIWLPDGRSLCDRRALVPVNLTAMNEDQFEAFMAEQSSSPACGPCLLLAGRIRRQACAVLEGAGGVVHPALPTKSWEQLRGTRWATQLDLDAFLAREDLDRQIRYEAVGLEVDRASVDDLLAEERTRLGHLRRAWERRHASSKLAPRPTTDS